MQWTLSSIRQRTASDRVPVNWTITLQHMRQISLEKKMNPKTNQEYYSCWTGSPIPTHLPSTVPPTIKFRRLFWTLETIVPVVTTIFVWSFPDSWKAARVCPIPKIDNPVTVKDFRPISILPVLSKVYEKVILSQLLSYIERSAVYNPTQSGFRKGHSTTTLLPKFRSGIRKALNGNEITISILNDYSKAFGTINHKTFWKSSFHWTLAIEQ